MCLVWNIDVPRELADVRVTFIISVTEGTYWRQNVFTDAKLHRLDANYQCQVEYAHLDEVMKLS